jgi:hypothetical protein
VEVLVFSNNCFTLIAKGSSSCQCIIVNVRKDKCSNRKVTNRQVISGNKVFPVFSKNLIKVFGNIFDVFNVGIDVSLVKVFCRLIWINLGCNIGAKVYRIVSDVSSLSFTGVKAVLFAKKT